MELFMNFEKLLNLGVDKDIITVNQKIELLQLLTVNENESKTASVVVKILYYLGGFIMLCAMTVLMSHSIQHSSYSVLLALGSLYASLFLFVANFLWKKYEKFPAGILYFLFITTISFIILDIEKWIGFFPHFSDIDKIPNYDEACRLPVLVLAALTVITNTILQKFRKVSILAIPNIFATFIIYLTTIHYFIGNKLYTAKTLTHCYLIFNIVLFTIAFLKDKLTEIDYSKWMYFFSAIGIFQAMINIFVDYYSSEAVISFKVFQAQCFLLSIIYCFLGLLIKRKPFTIIGILGIIEYIIYLEFHLITNNTLLLTSIISLTGLFILYIGVVFNRYSDKITSYFENFLPKNIRHFLPQYRQIKKRISS